MHSQLDAGMPVCIVNVTLGRWLAECIVTKIRGNAFGIHSHEDILNANHLEACQKVIFLSPLVIKYSCYRQYISW